MDTRDRFYVQAEAEPYAKGGVAYRAYLQDDSPLYMGEESEAAIVARVLALYPKATYQGLRPDPYAEERAQALNDRFIS